MGDHLHSQKVPLAALVGAALLISATVGLAANARAARIANEPAASAPPIASMDARFEDRANGSIAVFDATTGAEVVTLTPSNDGRTNSNGFVRGVLRGMFRARKLDSISRDEKFILARQQTGRLTLEDPTNHRKIELDSFGPTNGSAFGAILDADQAMRKATPAIPEKATP